MMRQTSVILMFALGLVSIVCVAPTSAAPVIGVPGDYGTIQAAIDAARDGDTIIVASGTYDEKLKIAGKRITLASEFHIADSSTEAIKTTILDGGKDGKKKGAPIITIKSDATLTLIGFTIQNSHHAVVNSGRVEVLNNRFVENGDALSFEDGSGIVRYNVFEHNSDDGIDLDGASAAIIEDNEMRENKDDGIEIRLHKYRGDTLEIVIRRNVFAGNREDGLQLIDYPGISDRAFRIERNVFVGNEMAGIGTMADGNTKENYEGADMLEPVIIVNNTIVDSRYGITGGDNMVLFNNVIVGSAKSALKRVHGDSAAGVNLLWHNGADVDECDLNTEAFLDVDPKLDKQQHPMPGSPCLDAGVATFKHHGETVSLSSDSYSGSAPDLGALEGTP